LHPVPKITFLPIVLILFGLGENSRLILISFSAFFPMVINCMAAVLQINPIYFEVAENYGAGTWSVFRRVVWPGSLAGVLTGARLSLVRALGATIVIEIRYANEGLGEVIWTSWETLRTTHLYSVVILIAALGVSINSTLLRVRSYIAPWHKSSRA
jgi:NitT/TauT family transport system permease protein